MKCSLRPLCLGLGAWCLLPNSAWGRSLSLEEFLGQVRAKNHEVQASIATIEATALRENSTDLMFTPQFVSTVARQYDEKPQGGALAGKSTAASSVSFGIQKLWSFGLQSQVSYSLTDIDIMRDPVPATLPVIGTAAFPPPVVPNPLAALGDSSSYSEAQLKLELSQPLLKNGFGRDYENLRESTQAKLTAQRQGEQYKGRLLRTKAEFVYWQLALASEAVRTQEGALGRFQKIRDWVKSRVGMQLADKADLLQAEAGVKARRLELELSQRDRIGLARNFNSRRGVNGDKVDDLQSISSRVLNDVPTAPGGVKRLDVEIAKQVEQVAQLEVEASREKFKSELNVFGTVAMNSDQKDSMGQAFRNISSDKPTLLVGLKFSTPLGRDLINRERNGLIKASESARADREAKEFAAQQEWEDLQRQLSDARIRLQLATEIEKAQKLKLEYERERHQRGRTTTYQIILFEQDYANAELGTIKAKADILSIQAKLKSFGDAL